MNILDNSIKNLKKGGLKIAVWKSQMMKNLGGQNQAFDFLRDAIVKRVKVNRKLKWPKNRR